MLRARTGSPLCSLAELVGDSIDEDLSRLEIVVAQGEQLGCDRDAHAVRLAEVGINDHAHGRSPSFKPPAVRV